MPRQVKSYPPEARRYLADGLLCPLCGNTSAFAMDLRLKHSVQVSSQGLEVSLSRNQTDKVLRALGRNLRRVLDRGIDECRPLIKCANCGEDSYVDLHERILDACWSSGCPGCWWCGNWIDREELLEACRTCVLEHHGEVIEDDCCSVCGYCDSGLSEVQAHYGITLEEIKHSIGY